MIPKSIAAIRPSAQREQVAVVEVGVEEAVDHRLPEEGADQGPGERSAIVAGRDQRVAVVELDAVEPFERQHSARGSAPVDLRHIIAGLGDHILAQLGRRSGLALQVELARGPLAELGDDQPRPQPLDLAAVAFDMRRRPFVGLDRFGELVLDAGAEHLHRDVAAFGGDRAVDLRDRGGADGLFIELARRGFRAARRRTSRSSA